jgi:hypothetical protein
MEGMASFDVVVTLDTGDIESLASLINSAHALNCFVVAFSVWFSDAPNLVSHSYPHCGKAGLDHAPNL